jgi:hypothetical protein
MTFTVSSVTPGFTSAGTGTPSWVSPNVRLGVPFATPARGLRHTTFDRHRAIHAATTFNGFLARGGGVGNSSLRDSTGQRGASRPANGRKLVFGTKPGRTEPVLAPRKSRHGLARARPDSPALRPLHSNRSSPAFRRNNIGSMPGLCSFVPRPQTAETGGKRRALPKRKQAPPVVSTAIFRPLHSAGAPFHCSEKCPTSLRRQIWSDTSAISLRAGRLTAPRYPCGRRADAPPDGKCSHRGVSANRARAGATRPNEPRPRIGNAGSADGCHAGCEPGSRTRAVIFKAAPMPYPAGA